MLYKIRLHLCCTYLDIHSTPRVPYNNNNDNNTNDDVDDDNDYDGDDDDVHNTRTRATTPTSAYNRESQSAHLRGWGQGGITTLLLPSIF
jgi:hypothetical protein